MTYKEAERALFLTRLISSAYVGVVGLGVLLFVIHYFFGQATLIHFDPDQWFWVYMVMVMFHPILLGFGFWALAAVGLTVLDQSDELYEMREEMERHRVDLQKILAALEAKAGAER